MVLSADMKAIIIGYHRNREYGARKIVSLVRTEKLDVSTVQRLLNKFKATGTTIRTIGSGRPRSIRTPTTIAAVLQRVVSEKDRPGTHKSQWKISREVRVS
jgi:hypothetical protein